MRLQLSLGEQLDAVLAKFKPGAKVTLVVRNPSVGDDAGVVIGNDDLNEAIAEIRRQQSNHDLCEHGVKCGDWCEPCNRESKSARAARGDD